MKLMEMVKSIAEEADSFARKVEKKHPLLKKLIEELYKALHILAEAFPNQMRVLTQNECIPETPQDLQTGLPRIPVMERRMQGLHIGKMGLQQLNGLTKSDENEVEALKKALRNLQAEKEAFQILYQLSLQKLSTMEKESETCKQDIVDGNLQVKDESFKLIELCNKHPDKMCVLSRQLGELVQKDEILWKNTHLDRGIKAQRDVLQKSVKDLEQNNLSVMIESRNCVEESELSGNSEILWDEIENLKKELVESKAGRERVEKQISELFQICEEQRDVIKHISDLSRNLESRTEFLSLDIEEPRVREKFVCSEQQEQREELEIWDAESASFHFDLQMSAARDVLFELTESSVDSSESEIRKPENRFPAFLRVVDSPKHDTESLEKSVVTSKLRHGNKQTQSGIRGIEQGNRGKQGNLRLQHKSEDSSFELPRNSMDKAKILKRLGSGSRKLTSLSTTVNDLKTRIGSWERNGRIQSYDLEKVRRQMKEMEDCVSQLIQTNDALTDHLRKQRT